MCTQRGKRRGQVSRRGEKDPQGLHPLQGIFVERAETHHPSHHSLFCSQPEHGAALGCWDQPRWHFPRQLKFRTKWCFLQTERNNTLSLRKEKWNPAVFGDFLRWSQSVFNVQSQIWQQPQHLKHNSAVKSESNVELLPAYQTKSLHQYQGN